jgi:glycosyltransferase involved in cell wall biosynthesis
MNSRIKIATGTGKDRGLVILLPRIGIASETFIRRHVNELAPGQTVAITWDHPEPYWKEQCPVLRLEEIPIWSPERLVTGFFRRIGYAVPVALFGTMRFLRKHGVQVALGQYLNHSLQWFRVLKTLGIKFYLRAHGFDVYLGLGSDRTRDAYQIYNDADGIIVNTPLMARQLKEIGIERSPIHVIPCGVDIPNISAMRGRDRSVTNVLAVGRMVPFKAPLKVLEAFRRALEIASALRLNVVGDGPLLDEAKRFAHENGVADVVRFYGAVDHGQVLSLMREAHVFMHHSMPDPVTGQEETLGVAILEAMAHGLPVVSTRSGGIPWVVDDGVTGFLCEPGDAQAKAEHLAQLALEEPLRQKLGRAARDKACSQFSWDLERQRMRALLGFSNSGH